MKIDRREIAEAAWQMALYGGLLAAINALNVIIDAGATGRTFAPGRSSFQTTP